MLTCGGVEHDCVDVLNTTHGENGKVYIDVGAHGVIGQTVDGQPFDGAIWDDLVAVQGANSETGDPAAG